MRKRCREWKRGKKQKERKTSKQTVRKTATAHFKQHEHTTSKTPPKLNHSEKRLMAPPQPVKTRESPVVHIPPPVWRNRKPRQGIRLHLHSPGSLSELPWKKSWRSAEIPNTQGEAAGNVHIMPEREKGSERTRRTDQFRQNTCLSQSGWHTVLVLNTGCMAWRSGFTGHIPHPRTWPAFYSACVGALFSQTPDYHRS